jgi:hypothetical protein
MTADKRDPILDRLRAIDPARSGDADEELVRANVKRRSERALGSPVPPRRPRRTGFLLAGAGGMAAAALAIVLAGGSDGLSPGPERALAIQSGPNGVTLTIEDAGASADEMNQELEAAGIDQVRVFSVPGSPNHAGTWAGQIELVADCEGAPTRLGYGIRIPYHTIDAPPAPGKGFIDLELPQGPLRSDQVIGASVVLQSGSGKRAIVSTDTEDGSTYAPAVLIAIRSRSQGDRPDAKTFGIEELAALGGDFEPYAQALSDGSAECEELGLAPRPAVSPGADQAERLLRDGPVVGRCVVKVLGTGLFSIEGEVAARDARKIHACSERIGDAARREHEQLRARREQEIERIDSLADLPAFVRARLEPSRSTERAPHGGVNPSKQGIDTGAVVLNDYDGRDHRTSPKRPGQYVNLLCAARGGKDRGLYATTFFDGEPVANARVSCRAHGPPRSNHVVRLGELGVYEIHLNGAGFDDFVIRTQATSKGGAHPNIVRPPDYG